MTVTDQWRRYRAPGGSKDGRRHQLTGSDARIVGVLGRAASLRVSVITATARIRRWQACPWLDPAPSAEHVLEEVRLLLEDGGTRPVQAADADIEADVAVIVAAIKTPAEAA